VLNAGELNATSDVLAFENDEADLLGHAAASVRNVEAMLAEAEAGP
jgi:hypothetical protein